MAMRLNAKRVFLTYPHCPLTVQDVLENIQLLAGPTYKIDKYVISTEKHDTGDDHIHAIIEFNKPFNSRDATRAFDIHGYHPNIQRVKRVDECKAYVKKDGKFIEHWPEREKKPNMSDLFEAESKEDFMEKAKINYPEKYILQMERLEYAAEKLYGVTTKKYKSKYERSDFNEHILMEQWVTDLKNNKDRQKALVLYSEDPALGKTSWARCLGHHAYVMSYWDPKSILKSYRPEYLILDDMVNTDFNIIKQLLNKQEYITLTGKYFKPKLIEWNIPTIICTNTRFWEKYENHEQHYFKKATEIITIRTHLARIFIGGQGPLEN